MGLFPEIVACSMRSCRHSGLHKAAHSSIIYSANRRFMRVGKEPQSCKRAFFWRCVTKYQVTRNGNEVKQSLYSLPMIVNGLYCSTCDSVIINLEIALDSIQLLFGQFGSGQLEYITMCKINRSRKCIAMRDLIT